MLRTLGIFLAISGVLSVLWFYAALRAPQAHSTNVVAFTVQPGEPLGVIQRHLVAQGLVKNPLVFKIWARFKGVEHGIQAGEYRIPQNMSVVDLVSALQQGLLLVPDRPITLIEGWTMGDIGAALAAQGIASKEEFQKLVPQDFVGDFPFLKEIPSGMPLEGYLFPDTYLIPAHANIRAVVRRMLENFQAKIMTTTLQELLSKSGHTLHEVLTIASLLEGEVRTPEDRRLVAGIIQKRLAAGMPLQIDATVLHALGRHTSILTITDLAIDSPYNTYKYVGLPPGPINNPSLMAFEAVLSPQKSPFWYYLSAPDGTTVFSKTFSQHVAAKAKYLGR